jgi:hypothetical protein
MKPKYLTDPYIQGAIDVHSDLLTNFMQYKFIDKNKNSYIFKFLESPNHIDVFYKNNENSSYPRAWIHQIKDGKIVQRFSPWLSAEAEDYINRIIQLRIFI